MASGRQFAVSLRSVTVRIGDTLVLDDVSLDVAPGERVALVGPSGAGKTTLLMVVNGTVPPHHGGVSVLGRPPAGDDRRGRRGRSRVGAIYQHLHLAGPLQVVHNVNAGRLPRWSLARALWSLLRPPQSEALQALERVGIAGKLRQRTERLSGGEQQRVAIARALVQQPDILLADEPVSSLDPARAREVMDLFRGLAVEAGRTLIVSLHAFDLARSHCDRIVGLRDGRVVFDLPTGAVSDEIAAALYDLGTA